MSGDPDLLDSLAVAGHRPRTAIVLTVEAAYFQCSRAMLRAALWDPARHVAPGALPTPGEILAALSDDRVGGPDYDAAWPERARASMW